MTYARRTTRSPRRVGVMTALAALFIGASALLSGSPAVAADNGSWSVTPTPPAASSAAPRDYFVLDTDPQTTLKDSLRIKNFTNKPISFTLYGADGYNTEKDGFFALKGVDEPQVDVGSWIRLPVTSVTVDGLTQVDVPFTIKVPKNATPGDHSGGVVAMNNAVESSEDAGNFDVGVQRAVAARMYVRVSGATTPGLEVDNVTITTDRGALPWSGSGNGTVSYTIENTGNLRLSPTSSVTLSGAGGRSIAEVADTSVPDLLPGQKVTITTDVTGIPWTDHLSAHVVSTTPEGARSEADGSAWLTPWPGLVGIVLLIGAGATLLIRRRTAMRRKLKAAESAPRIDIPAGR
jgi:hypothetical protein